MSNILHAIERLPSFSGVAFRGLANGEAEPHQLGVVNGAAYASLRARAAAENLVALRLLVLLNRTVRNIAPFSQHPEEGEVVVRPGSVWHRLISITVPGLEAPALVLEELDPSGPAPVPEGWGDTRSELAARVRALVEADRAAEAAPIAVPGKYSGAWPAQALPV